MKDVILLFDPGHGKDWHTSGKCSPVLNDDEFNVDDETVYNMRLREGNFNRLIVNKLVSMFNNINVDARNIVPEDDNISLKTRVDRANKIAKENKNKLVLYISVHANAAGNGSEWKNARGLSVHVCNKCSTNSKLLAQSIYRAAMPKFKGNRSVNSECLWYNDFYVIKYTSCPAVLIENLFYDNKEDIKILISKEGRDEIAQYIYMGICNFIYK